MTSTLVVVAQGATYRRQGLCRQWYMIKRGLTLVNAMQWTVLPHIAASVFINDDERGLHHDYEVWLGGRFSLYRTVFLDFEST